MNTQAIFFSFDMFGSPGTASGVHLLADEIREILADNRRETVPTRADAYSTDLRLREIDFPNLASLEKWRERGRKLARPVFQSGEFLLWFSGNHLGTLPLYDELSLATDKVVVLQFDAHLDIHHFRDCSSELSHGNFLRHCAGPLPPLINLGHRDLLLPRDTISEYFQSAFSVVDLVRDSQAVLRSVQSQLSKADRVF
ncbi:MAG: arginase family protein, partial [Gemmataceae bacterium]